MIINIRGTSGSGKTYTVRSFMESCGAESLIHNNDGKVVAHLVHFQMIPVYIIGSYMNVCGGCDVIPTQNMVCSLVRHFSQFGHVMFEGLIASHLYARYVALWKELTSYDIPFVFAYMDTPLEICIERVKQRRLDRGDTRKFSITNTVNHHTSTFNTKRKFEKVGIDTVMIEHKEDPVAQIVKLLMMDDLGFEHSYRVESFR